MFTPKSGKLQTRIDSLIGSGTTIEGSIKFEGGLRIDGFIRGDVLAASDKATTLVVSEQARIEGQIRVSHVVINGNIIGSVEANEYVELQSKAKVMGDLRYKKLEIHLGAVLEGKLIFMDDARDDTVVPFKPAVAEV